MVAFYPEFETNTSDTYEVVFLLDLSNSMKGAALKDAKSILLLALHHLPANCRFNVVIFGTGIYVSSLISYLFFFPIN